MLLDRLKLWAFLGILGFALVFALKSTAVTLRAPFLRGREPASEPSHAEPVRIDRHLRHLVFLHIPKNGGTTIEDIGAEHGFSWGARYFCEGWKCEKTRMPDNSSCSPWHVPPTFLSQASPYHNQSAQVFCVVRDPWSKMRSEYIYRVSVYNKWPAPFVMDGPACSVDGFNTWARAVLAEFERGNRFHSDCHLLPQWDFVQGPEGQRWCHHLLPLEDLTSSFNKLLLSQGQNFTMQPSRKSNTRSKCPQLGSMPLEQLFWQDTREAMRRVYKVDFANLGDSLLNKD